MTAPRWLAGLALALGGLATLAGSPYRGSRGRIDVDALAAAVVREQDHVTAIELAHWIRDRKAGLRVVDVRPSAEFAGYQIPTAENITVDALSRAAFTPRETVVLYSGGGADAAQAWVLLRAMGLREVFFLRGGLTEWLDEVMEPSIAEDATPEDRAAFDQRAAISRYFGGRPRIGPAGSGEAAAARTTPLAERLRIDPRRGC